MATPGAGHLAAAAEVEVLTPVPWSGSEVEIRSESFREIASVRVAFASDRRCSWAGVRGVLDPGGSDGRLHFLTNAGADCGWLLPPLGALIPR